MARGATFIVPLGSSSADESKRLTSSGNEWQCCEPRWFIIDVDVRSEIQTGPGLDTPTDGSNLPTSAPLHLEIGYGVEQSEAPGNTITRTRRIDAIGGRYVIFGNAPTVHVLTPAGRRDITNPGQSIPYPVGTWIFASIDVGIAAVVGECVPGVTGNRRAQYTWRQEFVGGSLLPEVIIPANAVGLQIYDTVAWGWSRPTGGTIPVVAGASAQVLVPNAQAIAPRAPTLDRRTAVLVWEILL